MANNQDYKRHGVLLVDLNIDLKGRVDTCRIKASEVLLAAVNIKIGNMDWEGFKDEELPLIPSDEANENAKPPGRGSQAGSQ